MKVSYKKRTLAAIKLLIAKYDWLLKNAIWSYSGGINEEKTIKKIIKSGKQDWFLDRDDDYFPSYSCPLCEVYYKQNGSCRGCPATNFSGKSDCTVNSYYNKTKAKKRKTYWEERLRYLETVPDRYFTPGGWDYFKINNK